MNKKLILNKETIAQLTNPDRIFGGNGAPKDQTNAGPTCQNTCATYLCDTCNGATCNGGATCFNVQTCYGANYDDKYPFQWACHNTESVEACATNPPTYLP